MEIGPIPATIAKFEELIIFIETDTKKDELRLQKRQLKNLIDILPMKS